MGCCSHALTNIGMSYSFLPSETKERWNLSVLALTWQKAKGSGHEGRTSTYPLSQNAGRVKRANFGARACLREGVQCNLTDS